MKPQRTVADEIGFHPATRLLTGQSTGVIYKSQLFQGLCRFVGLGALSVASYFFVTQYVFQTVEIIGHSMTPTLNHSEMLVLNRWVYNFREPNRSDVVVFRDPTDNAFSVKRIIARSGDSVYMKDGDIYVNGVKLQEPYLPRGIRTYPHHDSELLIVCGKGQYFVLGDNRTASYDSRHYGAVPRQKILGVVLRSTDGDAKGQDVKSDVTADKSRQTARAIARSSS